MRRTPRFAASISGSASRKALLDVALRCTLARLRMAKQDSASLALGLPDWQSYELFLPRRKGRDCFPSGSEQIGRPSLSQPDI